MAQKPPSEPDILSHASSVPKHPHDTDLSMLKNIVAEFGSAPVWNALTALIARSYEYDNVVEDIARLQTRLASVYGLIRPLHSEPEGDPLQTEW